MCRLARLCFQLTCKLAESLFAAGKGTNHEMAGHVTVIDKDKEILFFLDLTFLIFASSL